MESLSGKRVSRSTFEKVAIYEEKGHRINVFGLINRQNECHWATTRQNIDSAFVWGELEKLSFKIKKETFVILDNASVHHSQIIQQQIPVWQNRGLFLFFLRSLNNRGMVYVTQHGPTSGLTCLSINQPAEGSLLYFQNFTALNDYCQAHPDRTVQHRQSAMAGSRFCPAFFRKTVGSRERNCAVGCLHLSK